MEKTTSNKMIHVFPVILSILVVLLSTALFMQGRQLNKLKERLKVNVLAEKSQTDIADSNSSEESPSQHDEGIYKKVIS